jgi:crotonobetainyl-CoA:carnitine CoA-transferase CaiB-like acyl-CoA transferase
MASETDTDSAEVVETSTAATGSSGAGKGAGEAAPKAARSRKTAAKKRPPAKPAGSKKSAVSPKAKQAASGERKAAKKTAEAVTEPTSKEAPSKNAPRSKKSSAAAKKPASASKSAGSGSGANAKVAKKAAPSKAQAKKAAKAPSAAEEPAATKTAEVPAEAEGSEAPASKATEAATAQKGTKRAPLPGPEIKRAPKKSIEKTTTHEKLETAEQKQVADGRRPLDGIRVLDLSRLLPGPYASHILASFGADVIKIEKPGEGDYMREYLPQTQGFNATFLTINRGKRSIALDLRKAAGKEVFRSLVLRSDVVLDGFRPGVMDKLGLGYEKLSELNPKIVYAALTGYGQTGPNAQQAGHDLNYLALSGMLDLLGDTEGVPLVPGIQIADVAAGALPTVIGILLALQHRAKSKVGQMVDISMFDSLLGLMPVQVANYTATKRRPKRGHERLFGRYACYNIYPVRNGRFMVVAALEPKFWAALCTAIDREDLIQDQYVEGHAQDILIAELTRIFQKKQVDEWMEIFGECDACVTEVRELSRSVQDDNVTQRGLITPIRGKDGEVYEQLGVFPRLSDAPGYIAGDAPRRGEHTRQILKSLKYPAKQIEELVAAKVVEESGTNEDGGAG